MPGPYTFSRDWAITNLAMDARGSRFRLRGDAIICPLAGEHQVENARVAAIALAELGVSPAGIAATRWPARLEHVSEQPEIMIDGAHNPAGMRALADYIRRFYSGRRIWIVYGALRDKAVAEMASDIVSPGRSLDPDSAGECARHAAGRYPAEQVLISHTPLVRPRTPGPGPPNDVIFITGSLYLAGEARAVLVK